MISIQTLTDQDPIFKLKFFSYSVTQQPIDSDSYFNLKIIKSNNYNNKYNNNNNNNNNNYNYNTNVEYIQKSILDLENDGLIFRKQLKNEPTKTNNFATNEIDVLQNFLFRIHNYFIINSQTDQQIFFVEEEQNIILKQIIFTNKYNNINDNYYYSVHDNNQNILRNENDNFEKIQLFCSEIEFKFKYKQIKIIKLKKKRTKKSI
ncbi:hypothetical protein M0812_01545 [Anaeramoeba flamelloides]|uniref:Uncharacterized protein n=1 Tax=Anaeramoeba flamelloides TaxID=1746091 RepID=A0AAV7ZM62_9EUKA|nr:hypothetical protein M0812_01545 [Anaeramoeba flamelloides]